MPGSVLLLSLIGLKKWTMLKPLIPNKNWFIKDGKLWKGEFYNDVSAKDRVQDINLNQLKLKVNDAYKKDEKITTKVEPSHDDDAVIKTHLATEVSKVRKICFVFRKRLYWI